MDKWQEAGCDFYQHPTAVPYGPPDAEAVMPHAVLTILD
eukprot:gene9291-1671_t